MAEDGHSGAAAADTAHQLDGSDLESHNSSNSDDGGGGGDDEDGGLGQLGDDQAALAAMSAAAAYSRPSAPLFFRPEMRSETRRDFIASIRAFTVRLSVCVSVSPASSLTSVRSSGVRHGH